MYLPCPLITSAKVVQSLFEGPQWRQFSSFFLLIGLFLLSPSSAFAATITFQTEPGRPRIVGSTPSHLSGNFAVQNSLSVEFDQPMDVSTLNTTNIKLVDLSTGAVFPSWGSGSTTTTSTRFQSKPGANLDNNRTYALVITTGVRSQAGRTLDPSDPHHRSGTLYGEAWVIEFSTGTFTPAMIKNTNIGNIMGRPDGGQVNVPVNAIIRVNFERAMDPNTINSNNVVLRKTGGETTVPVTLSYDDVSLTAIITPVSPLDYGTSYTLTLIGLQDSLGNPLP